MTIEAQPNTQPSTSAAVGAGVCTPTQIDPRGPRFGGAVTTVVLAFALITIGSTLGTVLIAWQTLVFALGAFVGLQAQPYGWVFRTFVRPRLATTRELEDAAPPRFAQLVGFTFLVIALAAALLGAKLIATIAVACALGAAFLNAAFNICLGCEIYLVTRRLISR